MDRVQATVEFPEPGRVAGNASCNRFFGSVEATEQMIKIGSLGSTKMACAEAVNNQEIQARRAARHLRRQLRYRSGPSVRSRSGHSTSTTRACVTTPDDPRGIHFPPIAPRITGDTAVWVGETERAAFDNEPTVTAHARW